MLLAGDIGGTKTVLGLFSINEGPHNPIAVERYLSSSFPTLEDLVADFLTKHRINLDGAAIGVAGPVREGQVEGTNLPWIVSSSILSTNNDGLPVFLLNDLEAIAYSVPRLIDTDVEVIKVGRKVDQGPIAILAPGTGLGEAFLFWDGYQYKPIPSEGGHTDFAPATADEVALLTFLQKRYRHVSYERVCSGIGIPNIFSYLSESGRYPIPQWLILELEKSKDWTPIIIQSAIEKSASISQATLAMFLGILGSEAGNLALQILATGGVFLGGGIPPRILPELKGKPFVDAFTRKGRLSDLLWHVQVSVITNPLSALYGAATYGLGRTYPGHFP